MPQPLTALHFIHNAIRREVSELETAVAGLETADALQFDPLAERFGVLAQLLHDHEHAEESVFFPALEAKAPHVIKAYEMDHRSNDDVIDNSARAFERLRRATSAPEAGGVARELFVHAVELRATLRLHLLKEEQHLVPVAEQYYAVPEQGALVGRLTAAMPHERFSETVAWIFLRLADEDRAGLLGIMRAGAPPPVFQVITTVISQALPADEWRLLRENVGLGAGLADPASSVS